jgi:hypothetical protein
MKLWQKKVEIQIYRNRKVSIAPYETEDIFISIKQKVPVETLDMEVEKISRYLEGRIRKEEQLLKAKRK